MIYDGTAYGYLYNLQGDVVALVDGTGTKVIEYTYDAWGKPTGKTGTLASTLGTVQPFRYRGYVFDEETGDYYCRSRHYRAEWGRFLNADIMTKGNLYTYCANDPIILYDKDGTQFEYTDVKAALRYMITWYNSYNFDKFYEYEDDCGNYVSQCVLARGFSMDEEWHSYYTVDNWLLALLFPNIGRTWDVSAAWQHPNEQHDYFVDSRGYPEYIIHSPEEVIELTQRGLIGVADPIYFDYDGDGKYSHAVVASIIFHDGTIGYSAHTNPRMDYPLYHAFERQGENMAISIVHLGR